MTINLTNLTTNLSLKQFLVFYHGFFENFEPLITQTGNCELKTFIKTYRTKESEGLHQYIKFCFYLEKKIYKSLIGIILLQ